MTIRPQTTVTWHGSNSEQRDLLAAVQRNCACASPEGAHTSVCAAHRMLIEDQRALDGLLFARRLAPRLHREEGLAGPYLSCQVTTTQVESPAERSGLTSNFTAQELGRLAMYRAAVEADLYTDLV